MKPDLIVWLPASVLATITILGIIAAALRKYGKRAIERHELLQTIANHTKQLTTNGGEHLADAVRRTERKVDSFDAKWDERQAALDAALETQQVKVAAELDTHRGETAVEIGKVWRELATREIHKAADQFIAEADRVENAKPWIEN